MKVNGACLLTRTSYYRGRHENKQRGRAAGTPAALFIGIGVLVKLVVYVESSSNHEARVGCVR